MNNMGWMISNNDDLATKAVSVRGFSNSGIVSGLEVERVPDTLALRVLPGVAVISGAVFELKSIYDGLVPAQPYDTAEVFVVLEMSEVVENTTNIYGESIVARSYPVFNLRVVPLSEYVQSDNTIVLAHCRYTAHSRYPDDPAYQTNTVQLPRNVFGVFPSIEAASQPDVTSLLRTGDSVVVRSYSDVVISGQLVSEEHMYIYSWEVINDPVLLKDIVHPDPQHATFDAYGIWAQSRDLSSPVAMLQYSIPDVVDPDENVGWIEYPTHHWVNASLEDHKLTQEYIEQLNGWNIEIDVSSNRYGFMRTVFSCRDVAHREDASRFGDARNIHGIGFNDIGYDVMPLHRQIFDTGFGVSPMDTQGILGKHTEETVMNINISIDYFGTFTGVLGNRYIRMRHVPVSVSYLLETSSGNNIAYELRNDIVVLGPDFVGGSFRTYDAFLRTRSYAVGDRVYRVESGIDKLYQAIRVWDNPGSSEIDGFDASYFIELKRLDLVVGYSYIEDLEYSIADNSIYVAPNTTSAIVSEGHVIDPSEAQTQKIFNLNGYKDVVAPKLTLSYSRNGEIVANTMICDKTSLSTRRSSSKNFGVDFGGSGAQIKLTLARTPITYDIHQPEGYMTVLSAGIHGRYRLFYTYGLEEMTVHATMSPISSIDGIYNLDPAVLLEGTNHIPRDSWSYSSEEGKVIIAGDVYRTGRSYRIWRQAAESPRNRRGYIEIVGTAPKPAGTHASATLSITEYDRLSVGDSITITFGDKSVTKTLQDTDGFNKYTGFTKGAGTASTLANIKASLELDPVFIAHAAASTNPTSLEITALRDGVEANAWNMSVSSTNTSLSAMAFSGGSVHVFEYGDLAGLSVEINDRLGDDDASFFSVWSTCNLDEDTSESAKLNYRRIITVKDNMSGEIVATATPSGIAESADTYDVSKELYLNIQIDGTDAEGSAISETIEIDNSNFCNIQNFRALNPYRFVRSGNVYSSITSWAVLDSRNIGSSVLTIVAESASGTRDLFDIVELDWTGSRIQNIKDRRKFIDAYTNTSTSTLGAEALSNVAALLQI
jgi:hypothetical protein